MNIKAMTLPELTAALKEMGQPGFRAKQIYTWLHKGVRSYDEMTNISKELRTELSQRYPFTPPEVVRRQQMCPAPATASSAKSRISGKKTRIP